MYSGAPLAQGSGTHLPGSVGCKNLRAPNALKRAPKYPKRAPKPKVQQANHPTVKHHSRCPHGHVHTMPKASLLPRRVLQLCSWVQTTSSQFSSVQFSSNQFRSVQLSSVQIRSVLTDMMGFERGSDTHRLQCKTEPLPSQAEAVAAPHSPSARGLRRCLQG